MNTKQKIVISSVVGIVALATVVGGYAVASKTPWKSDDPAAQFYASMVKRSKSPGKVLDDLAAQQAKRDEWNNLSAAEKEKRAKDSKARFEADVKARMDAQGGPKVLGEGIVTRGFLKDGVDAVYPGVVFRQLDGAWNGYVDGVLYVAVSGAYNAHPEQGVVIMFPTRTSLKEYLTPTATGPVRIVSEKDGVITLESQAGDWEVSNQDTGTRTTITTKGGVTYKFDTKTRTFVK